MTEPVVCEKLQLTIPGVSSCSPSGLLRRLAGSSAPGWFFRMWALRFELDLYTCTGQVSSVQDGICAPGKAYTVIELDLYTCTGQFSSVQDGI